MAGRVVSIREHLAHEVVARCPKVHRLEPERRAWHHHLVQASELGRERRLLDLQGREFEAGKRGGKFKALFLLFGGFFLSPGGRSARCGISCLRKRSRCTFLIYFFVTACAVFLLTVQNEGGVLLLVLHQLLSILG